MSEAGNHQWPGTSPGFRQELNRLIENEHTTRGGLFGGGEVDRRYPYQWGPEDVSGGFDQYGVNYGSGGYDSGGGIHGGHLAPPAPPLPSRDENESRPKLIVPQKRPWLDKVLPENMKEELIVAARGRLKRIGVDLRDFGLAPTGQDSFQQEYWQYHPEDFHSSPSGINQSTGYSQPPKPAAPSRACQYGANLAAYSPDGTRGYHPAQPQFPMRQPTIGDMMNQQQQRRPPASSFLPRPAAPPNMATAVGANSNGPVAAQRAPARPPRRIDGTRPPSGAAMQQQEQRPVPATRSRIPRPVGHAPVAEHPQCHQQQQSQIAAGRRPCNEHQSRSEMPQHGNHMPPPRAAVRDLTPRVPVPPPEPRPPRNWTPSVKTALPSGSMGPIPGDFMGHPMRLSPALRGGTPGPASMGGTAGARVVNPTMLMHPRMTPERALHRGQSMLSNASNTSHTTCSSYNPPSLSLAASSNELSGPRPIGASVSNLRQNRTWQQPSPPRMQQSPMGVNMARQQQQFHSHPQQNQQPWQSYQQHQGGHPHDSSMAPAGQEYYDEEGYYHVKPQSSRYKPDFQEVLQKFSGGQAFSRKNNGGDGYGSNGGYGAY